MNYSRANHYIQKLVNKSCNIPETPESERTETAGSLGQLEEGLRRAQEKPGRTVTDWQTKKNGKTRHTDTSLHNVRLNQPMDRGGKDKREKFIEAMKYHNRPLQYTLTKATKGEPCKFVQTNIRQNTIGNLASATYNLRPRTAGLSKLNNSGS
eukprot:4733274-Amphidinium_carterae.3